MGILILLDFEEEEVCAWEGMETCFGSFPSEESELLALQPAILCS